MGRLSFDRGSDFLPSFNKREYDMKKMRMLSIISSLIVIALLVMGAKSLSDSNSTPFRDNYKTTTGIDTFVFLSPQNATNPLNENHTFTATAQRGNGESIAGFLINFVAIGGPSLGSVDLLRTSGRDDTDSEGHAHFTYSSGIAGIDTFDATFLGSDGNLHHSENLATKEWVDTSPVGRDSWGAIKSLYKK